MKYRKKPIEVEAIQYDGDLIDRSGNWYVPDWLVKAYQNGTIYYGTLAVKGYRNEKYTF